MKRVKKGLIILAIVVFTLLFIGMTNVFANNTNPIQIPSTNNTVTNDTANNTLTNNTVANNVTVNNTTGNISAISNYTKEPVNNTTKLPQTGENDVYFIALGAVVLVIVAVFAYKKVRDYNNIK